MPQLIDRIVEILGRREGRLTIEEIARVLQEEGAWHFGGANPVPAVANALLEENHTASPRIIRFLDRYTLRRRVRVAAPEPSRPEPAPEPAAAPAPPELTGEGPRLLLDLLQGPRLADNLDGRTVAALARNRCVTVRDGWVTATESARGAMRRHLHGLARASTGRGSALFSAIADVVDAIPPGSEIPVKGVPTAAADVLLALYDAALATQRRSFAEDSDAAGADEAG